MVGRPTGLLCRGTCRRTGAAPQHLLRSQRVSFTGRLVSLFTFSESWNTWEMHPSGAEVVLCVAGNLTLHQERPDGSRYTVTLGPAEYAINAPGTWHTADVSTEVTALFITAGAGTQIRPR